MLGLNIDGEWRKATIIGRAQLIDGDILTRLDQIVTNLLRRLNLGIKRVDDADESDLFDTLGIFADRLADFFVDFFFVFFRRELDEEVAGVHLEHGGEEFVVVDVGGVDGIAVAAGAGVDAYVFAFGRAEAVEDSVFGK